MDIMELGAIGELISGVAVLVTLIYLARQIRQSNLSLEHNTQQLRAATETEAGDASFRLSAGLADPELCKALGIEAGPRRLVNTYLSSYCVAHQNQYFQARRRSLEPRAFATYQSFVKQLFQLPSVREWWSHFRGHFDPEFQAHMDGLIEAESVE